MISIFSDFFVLNFFKISCDIFFLRNHFLSRLGRGDTSLGPPFFFSCLFFFSFLFFFFFVFFMFFISFISFIFHFLYFFSFCPFLFFFFFFSSFSFFFFSLFSSFLGSSKSDVFLASIAWRILVTFLFKKSFWGAFSGGTPWALFSFVFSFFFLSFFVHFCIF